jgi:IMP cyclohydrolase
MAIIATGYRYYLKGVKSMQSVKEYFNNLVYPGRNIVVGRTVDGDLFFTYGIMGRSATSRNRIFKKEDGVIKTQAFDPSIVMDPSLIIYNAVKMLDGKWVVTNGNQTDTIYDGLNDGKTFEEALETRMYEDDDPNWTPRISAYITPEHEENKALVRMAIIKNNHNHPRRFFYNYSEIEKDTALIIQTYEESNDPLISFSGEPIEVSMMGINTIEDIAYTVFKSQHEDNRISLLGVNINTMETIIINSKEME